MSHLSCTERGLSPRFHQSASIAADTALMTISVLYCTVSRLILSKERLKVKTRLTKTI